EKMQVYFIQFTYNKNGKFHNDAVTYEDVLKTLNTEIQKWKTAVQLEMENIIEYLFKITGEGSFVSVVNTAKNEDLEKLIGLLPVHYEVTVTPLRRIENLASSITKLDQSILDGLPGPQIDSNKTAMWMDVSYGYQGRTFEEFRHIWKEEARVVLGGIAKGDFLGTLYKVAGVKRLLAFVQMDHEALDDLSWTLPLFTSLGDQVNNVVKSVVSV
ncbi:unnamed protein product, partial [Owenia fusiformis]